MSANRRVNWHQPILLLALLIPSFAAGDEPQPPRGTDVGHWIPTTTMWIVTDPAIASREGRNGCLAGINRDKRAISIYAREESPALWSLLKTIDDGLKDQPDLVAYVVIHKSLFDEAGYNRSRERFDATQQIARQQKFSRVVVSLSRQGDGTQLLPSREPLRVVYSDRRVVKLTRKFHSVDVEPDQVRQFLAEVLALTKSGE